MLKDDLIVGHVYSAKRPVITGAGYYNDRQILWKGELNVQYDSPSVGNGRKYPTVSIEKFLKWACADITENMPTKEWRTKNE